MLDLLYLTPYVSTNRLDQSREVDGLDMREAYLDAHGFAGTRGLPGQCTVLEVLVALCVRCERDITCEPSRDKTAKWFWDMMYYSGLCEYPNRAKWDDSEVLDILERVLRHKYDRDGRGSFFHIKHVDTDMRKLDLWSQMMRYIDEEIGDAFFDFDF